jgi:hypothetical protein
MIAVFIFYLQQIKMKSLILTTINVLSDEFLALYKQLGLDYMIVIGDRKTPDMSLEGKGVFFSIADQEKSEFRLAKILPYDHYSRKNLGYLIALKNRDEYILETDDDNFLDTSLAENNLFTEEESCVLVKDKGFENVYSRFTDEHIWPRGYPLDLIKKTNNNKSEVVFAKDMEIGVSQGLVNNDPDVDAIFRLVKDTGTTFESNKRVVLSKYSYCPFNSQSTLWKREYLIYAYLPSTVSIRYTDILRGYISQRCLWQHNALLEFRSPYLIQFRNDHSLLTDLKHEMEIFETVHLLIDTLNSMKLSENKAQNMREVYKALSDVGIVENTELDILEAWLLDVASLT